MNKRRWTRGEKWLFGAPLLILALGGAVWLWQLRAPKTIALHSAITMVYGVEFSPDSRRLLAFSQNKYGSTGGTVYDVETRAAICGLQTPGSVRAYDWPSWSPDGKRIVAGFDEGKMGTTKVRSTYKNESYLRFNIIYKIALWDAASGRLSYAVPYGPPTQEAGTEVYFAADGTLVGLSNPPSFFDPATGAPTRIFGSSYARVQRASFNRARTLLALCNDSGSQIEVREVESDRVLWQAEVHRAFSFHWSSDVLAIHDDGSPGKRQILLWDGKARRVLPSPPSRDVLWFHLHPHKPWVALADVNFSGFGPLRVRKSELVVWDYAAQKALWRRPMQGLLSNLKWSPDGRFVTLRDGEGASSDTAWVFDESGAVRYQKEQQEVGLIRWAPDSKQLAITSRKQIEILKVD